MPAGWGEQGKYSFNHRDCQLHNEACPLPDTLPSLGFQPSPPAVTRSTSAMPSAVLTAHENASGQAVKRAFISYLLPMEVPGLLQSAAALFREGLAAGGGLSVNRLTLEANISVRYQTAKEDKKVLGFLAGKSRPIFSPDSPFSMPRSVAGFRRVLDRSHYTLTLMHESEDSLRKKHSQL